MNQRPTHPIAVLIKHSKTELTELGYPVELKYTYSHFMYLYNLKIDLLEERRVQKCIDLYLNSVPSIIYGNDYEGY
jgi:hypothetical protein